MKTFKKKITINLDSDVRVSVKGFIAPIEYMEHKSHRGWNTLAKLRAAAPEQRYPASVFQSFLPPKSVAVEELWQIEEAGVLELLRQLHPNPTLDQCASCGLWACLRAYSDEFADIAFRIHAAFDLAEGRFTPSQFAGNLIVDRIEERVAGFRMHVPASTLNFNVIRWTGETYKGKTLYTADIGFCPQIALYTGTRDILHNMLFAEVIPQIEAARALAGRFYKSERIHWVPLEAALGLAQAQQKPIHALSIDGALDDESC